MLFSMYKRQSQTLVFPTLNQCLPIFRSYRAKTFISTTDSSAFRTSFLENQCGLSGKSLIRASNLLNFEPYNERPNSVLKLLQTFGFSQQNITKIISIYPRILLCYPQKSLKPKLEFLVSITQSETDVVQMVTKSPHILTRSLQGQLIPSFNLLKSVTGSDEIAATVVKCKPLVITLSFSKCFLPNMEFLLTIGVPHSQILKLLTYAHVLGKPHDKFCKIAMKLKEMGFDLSSSYFISAVQTLSFNTDSSWESRCELFRSFGFSDDEILSMFKKRPAIMGFSPKKTKDRMEFFVNKLGWSPARLSANPTVLSYSLEKRTVPRCSVLQVLVSKNITTRSIMMLSTIMAMTERMFLKHFVTAHKDDVPEVVDAHQGKLRFHEYTFESEGKILFKA